MSPIYIYIKKGKKKKNTGKKNNNNNNTKKNKNLYCVNIHELIYGTDNIKYFGPFYNWSKVN